MAAEEEKIEEEATTPVIHPEAATAVKCLPKEMKKALLPFLRNKARFYERENEPELSDEFYLLREVVKSVAPCTAGNLELASLPWLRNRGAGRESMEKAGGIHRLPSIKAD